MWHFTSYASAARTQHVVAPPSLQIKRDTIPQELLTWSRWLCCDWRGYPNRFGKTPISCRTGDLPFQADCLGTFDEAYSFYLKYGLAGIGFFLNEQDPFVCIDFDDCRDPRSRALTPWSFEVVEKLQSYTEVSPSGTGLHVILRGGCIRDDRMPFTDPEVFCTNWFITVTGHTENSVSTSIASLKSDISRKTRVLDDRRHSLGTRNDRTIVSAQLTSIGLVVKLDLGNDLILDARKGSSTPIDRYEGFASVQATLDLAEQHSHSLQEISKEASDPNRFVWESGLIVQGENRVLPAVWTEDERFLVRTHSENKWIRSWWTDEIFLNLIGLGSGYGFYKSYSGVGCFDLYDGQIIWESGCFDAVTPDTRSLLRFDQDEQTNGQNGDPSKLSTLVGTKILVANVNEVICLETRQVKELWRTNVGFRIQHLVADMHAVFVIGGHTITALAS